MSKDLRKAVIHLAYENPGPLRAALLPLLKQGATSLDLVAFAEDRLKREMAKPSWSGVFDRSAIEEINHAISLSDEDWGDLWKARVSWRRTQAGFIDEVMNKAAPGLKRAQQEFLDVFAKVLGPKGIDSKAAAGAAWATLKKTVGKRGAPKVPVSIDPKNRFWKKLNLSADEAQELDAELASRLVKIGAGYGVFVSRLLGPATAAFFAAYEQVPEENDRGINDKLRKRIPETPYKL